MDEIPSLTKKIAGKSLPIEKLCSRKARKFHSQNHRLFLPAMELAYVFGSLSHTPRRSLLHTLLPRIDKMLGTLEGVSPEEYGNGHEYWDGTFILLIISLLFSSVLNSSKTLNIHQKRRRDSGSYRSTARKQKRGTRRLMPDYTLGHFLRGVVQFTARYQPPESSPEARRASEGEASDEEIDAGAEKDFLLVLEHAPKVEVRDFNLNNSLNHISPSIMPPSRLLALEG